MQRSGFECHCPRDEVKLIVWPHGENRLQLRRYFVSMQIQILDSDSHGRPRTAELAKQRDGDYLRDRANLLCNMAGGDETFWKKLCSSRVKLLQTN